MKRFFCLMLAVLMLPITALAEDSPIANVMAMLADPAQHAELHAGMTNDMQAALPVEALGQLIPQLESVFGAYQGLVDDMQAMPSEGYMIYSQTVDMALSDLVCNLVMDGEGKIAGLNFTLAPQPETIAVLAPSITEEPVTVGEAPWALGGLLTLPASEKPVPAVVLVHGSGPSDMDESAYAVKPFRDIAAALSAQGIAVLRYDKRTYTHGEVIASGDMTAFTVKEETVEDAIAAGRLLANDSRIDPERIYVLGHSLGAMLAPRIASESEGLFAGMILANGTNASLAEVILQQNKDVVSELPEEQQAAYAPALTMLEQQVEAIPAMTAEEAKAAQFAGQSAYYFWEMMQHPAPAELLKSLALPTLIINGSRDFQVQEGQGRLMWEASLDMTAPWLTCLWPDVNHMMMRPEVAPEAVGTINEYAVPCTVDTAVTDAIATFILTEETK